MKRIKNFLSRSLTVVAPLALALAVFTANSTCLFFSYQPDEPEGLQRYKLRRRYSDLSA